MGITEQELLEVVIGVAGDNENMIREGIIRALRGINDKARRTYLWNMLSKKAGEKIHRERRKFSIAA